MTIETQVRRALDAHASSIQPTNVDTAWQDTRGELDRGVQRRHGGRVLAAAVVAAVAVALAVVIWPSSGPDVHVGAQRPDVPNSWTRVTNAGNDLTVWIPPTWQRLEPGTTQGGVEALTVGTTRRPSVGAITACSGDIPTAKGAYVSIYEYPNGVPLVAPTGEGGPSPSSFQARPPTLDPSYRGGVFCGAGGARVFSYDDVQNWMARALFSDGGRRFYVRIVTIQDPRGKQQRLAARVLNTLYVTPLTTGITDPPPVPPTQSPAAVRSQLLDVDLFARGECENSVRQNGAYVTQRVPCSQPHMFEYYATYSFKGIVLFGQVATEGCTLLFEEYTGHKLDGKDLGYSFSGEILNPDTAPAEGFGHMRCVISNVSGAPPHLLLMTGSPRNGGKVRLEKA